VGLLGKLDLFDYFYSYPRTESTAYSPNFNFTDILESNTDNPSFSPKINTLLSEGIQKPTLGINAGDHPPITPVQFCTPDSVNSQQWKVYTVIMKYFLASIYPKSEYDNQKYTFEINNR
jgi:DNA topoisomerase-3